MQLQGHTAPQPCQPDRRVTLICLLDFSYCRMAVCRMAVWAIFGHMAIGPYAKKYGQVRYPWKEL